MFCSKYKCEDYFNFIESIVKSQTFPDWLEYRFASDDMHNLSDSVTPIEISFEDIDADFYSNIELNNENTRYIERYESIKNCREDCYRAFPITVEKSNNTFLLIDGARTYDCWRRISKQRFSTPPKKVLAYVFSITQPPLSEKIEPLLDSSVPKSVYIGNNAQKRIKYLYNKFLKKYAENKIAYRNFDASRYTAKNLFNAKCIDKKMYNKLVSLSPIIDGAIKNDLPTDKEYFYRNIIKYFSEITGDVYSEIQSG